MTNVYITGKKLSSISQLHGTFGHPFAVELGNFMISGLTNEFNLSLFNEVIIGLTRSDYYDV